MHRYVDKDLLIPMILVLFAYCIAGGVHGEKIRKSTVRSLTEQPTVAQYRDSKNFLGEIIT